MKKLIAGVVISVALLGGSSQLFAGVRAPDTASSIEIVSPCGSNQPLHEVFLRVNGKLLTVVTKDPNQQHVSTFGYLAVVPDFQNQPTRDDYNCIFSVANGVVTD